MKFILKYGIYCSVNILCIYFSSYEFVHSKYCQYSYFDNLCNLFSLHFISNSCQTFFNVEKDWPIFDNCSCEVLYWKQYLKVYKELKFRQQRIKQDEVIAIWKERFFLFFSKFNLRDFWSLLLGLYFYATKNSKLKPLVHLQILFSIQ